MAEHPKVFISYSHDSPEHKQWVLELGTKLVQNGVDVVLDRWNLTPGDNFTQFMEVGVRDFDWVLAVCTDNYVRKANNREGGVGYEVQIVTAQLVENLGIDKFIPIIRHASGQEKMPTFLGGRVYIDFTDDSQFNEVFNELLHKLYDEPVVEKPPLGEKPSFAKLSSGREEPLSQGLNTQLPEISEQVKSASGAYLAAAEIAHAGDMFGWRRLVKQIKPSAFRSLVQWRQTELEGQSPKSKELFQVVDRAIEIISPLTSVALAGIESGREQFRDQKSTLYDLLNIPGWSGAGYEVWIDIPYALGYVYHSLHGSFSLSINQLDIALSLATAKIPLANGTRHFPVWKTGELIGYSKSISGTPGGHSLKGWKYLVEAYERKWEWLAPIFGEELEYQTALVAYYMALHIYELADIIASGQQDTLEQNLSSTSSFRCTVPLTFFSTGHEITQRAVTLLHNQEELAKLWTSLNVTREQMEDSWEIWIQLADNQLYSMYAPGFNPRAHLNLSDIFQHFFEGL